jgi:hypothetical protein
MKLKTNGWLVAVMAIGLAAPAYAQLGNGVNPECLGSDCGAPKEEGGGCGCGCGCSVWVSYTDDGKTLSYTDDADGDGKSDDKDNCPFSSNRDQTDGDGDGVGDKCDNCAGASNLNQLDTDGNGKGDACDEDIDGDGILNVNDNCKMIPNADQKKTLSGALLGDVCNSDDDGDTIPDATDNCPLVANANQIIPGGAVCKLDSDSDNIGDNFDNCPNVKNPNQLDTDGDGIGDLCDADIDNDGILNVDNVLGLPKDNCPAVRNATQIDDDGDSVGDSCDSKYCVVVDGANPADCLDPSGSFKVHGGGTAPLKRGEKFRLPLFANRNGAAIEYVWTVSARPSGSTAAIENPKGAVTLSRHWEYAYTDGHTPTFTADVDGEYTLQLQATLAFPDRAYPEARTSTSELKLSATPDGKNGSKSCSMIGFDAPLMGLGLALLSIVRRRKV